MLFNSFQFLIFFPCVFLLNYALPFKYRKYMLLAASYYFYMCWRADFIVLIVLSTCIDYFCGLGIEKHRENRRVANALLCVSMCMNLGLLFFFKYFNFFGQSLNAVFRLVTIPFSVPMLNVILPVGISFYTFQTMSYTIDVWRGKMTAEKDFATFALFVSFFPQLVAGPIEKATNLLPQLKAEHPFSYENATYGLKLMAWGFFKKLVIADRFGTLFVDPVYNNLSQYSGGMILLATAAFAFQIYCDFGGYSDIARGCARTMGINLMVNFRAPYFFSTSIADFWHRWHISLSNWLRDYIYIPLGGNRKGPWKKALFTVITFFCSGLWHGAAWTFVVWGLLQALYLNVENMYLGWRRRHPNRGQANRAARRRGGVCARLCTFALCCFSWVFFRANSMDDALYALSHCLNGIVTPLTGAAPFMEQFFNIGKSWLLPMAAIFLLLMLFDGVNEKRDTIGLVSSWPVAVRWTVYVGFMLVLLIMIPKTMGAPFIYFQF